MHSPPTTLLWHDYETFGIDPRSDRPAQFAAIRTDADLNEIGTPIDILCQPAFDYLPSAQSCLITGITPQQCQAQGLPEYQFAARIHAELSQPGTIGVGYNSIRFDDEFTRFLFWRNLIEPYGREWQNGCSRWDLLDVMRLCHALRPEGIVWPQNAEGKPSFKLEDLSAANGLEHSQAHDALSDVRATIALARLVKQAQPKLWDFALQLRHKNRVRELLGLPCELNQAQPFLHISGMIPPEYGCTAIMMPLAQHPVNANEIICWDLRHDPSALALISADEVRLRLFSKGADLPEGMGRLPIKTIHLNKSPMVVPQLKTLSEAQAARWQIDVAHSLQHADIARRLPDLSHLWAAVFTRPTGGAASAPPDVDGELYSGFIGPNDRRKLDDVRGLDAPCIHEARTAFEDERLTELFWRYRARNFVQSMEPAEQAQWFGQCLARVSQGEGGVRSKADVLAEVEALQAELASRQPNTPAEQERYERDEAVLEELYSYAGELEYSLEHWLEQLRGMGVSPTGENP